MSGEDRLLKNRADHRSSPNVDNQAQSPGGKPVYQGGPGTKITSVSTGNLCADEEPSPPHPEAYPIPTQTYTREYFTFPASKSQDRMGPGPGPGQPWQDPEDRPLDDHPPGNMALQDELLDERVGYAPDRLRPEDLVLLQQREAEYQRERGSGEHWNHQVPPPAPPPTARTDLPPPPLPAPVHYAAEFEAQPSCRSAPPAVAQQHAAAAAAATANAAAAADRKKREEQQRWYEKEKARLEEERERKRREQERKMGQIRNPAGPAPLNNQHAPPAAAAAPADGAPQSPAQVPQTYLPCSWPPRPSSSSPRPEKLASLPAGPPPHDTVIRELLPQQQPRTIERRDLQYITISKEELSSGDSLSPDPWKRDAREKLEKQQQLHIVDLLDREIQELQAKPERSAEENDRLRKLMLEWQFQKRLQESKQSDEDEEEEDDEDVDTVMIMQRLEAEKRARLQDEERRRKQQLEEIRKREAEERAKQEEERRRREEERARREAEEKRRQEEEYYTRLEAERRRQHEEAERRLLTPDEPGRLPDTLYTAKFVSYNDEEEEEEEEDAGLAAPPAVRWDLSVQLIPAARSQCQQYCGQGRAAPSPPAKPAFGLSGNSKGYNTYTGNTAGVVGSNEVYKDPREKWAKSGQELDASVTGGAPESLTFKERQRLFSQGKEVSNKVKASRKLMEIESELNTK
ncbi:hypothetical protein ANANG_G00117070 [Anguilla anguilla]|uniref:Afadin n=1 Tax=Anguilla anguilla TaxID=7936 RepID=A0A9D3MEK0_ANGAN|nr:hypothetical protein ANANG_G00117070 [Anguilla anguilla]